MLDHGHVVRDEQVRQGVPFLKIDHQVDDGSLNGDVERRDWLVGDDHLGFETDGARNRQALALAARELVRIVLHMLGVESNDPEKFGHAVPHRPAIRNAVDDERFADQAAGCYPRVQGRIRVLEHGLNYASERPHRAAVERSDVLPLQLDRTPGRRKKSENQLANGRLARATLAHEPKRLAGRDVEADACDGLYRARRPEKAAALRELLFEVVDFDQGCAGDCAARSS